MEKNSEKDKTVFFSSDKQNNQPLDGDKTQINMDGNATGQANSDENNTANPEKDWDYEPINNASKDEKSKDSKKSVIRTAAVAGGIGAAAGIAGGIAIGAANSEEINDFFHGETEQKPSPTLVSKTNDSSEKEANKEVAVDNRDHETSSEGPNDTTTASVQNTEHQPHHEEPSHNHAHDMKHSSNYEFVGGHDGHAHQDSSDVSNGMFPDSQHVDGVYEVHVVLHEVPSDTVYAEPEAISVDQISINHIEPTGDFMNAGIINDNLESTQYSIQPGDTLSEIAQAHNTTIDHIMELNPDISDADLIYAGNKLEVPLGDNASNPYADWDGVEDKGANLPEYSVDIDESLPTDDSSADFNGESEYYSADVEEIYSEETYAESGEIGNHEYDVVTESDNQMDYTETPNTEYDTHGAEEMSGDQHNDYILEEGSNHSDNMDQYLQDGASDEINYNDALGQSDFDSWNVSDSNYSEF